MCAMTVSNGERERGGGVQRGSEQDEQKEDKLRVLDLENTGEERGNYLTH